MKLGVSGLIFFILSTTVFSAGPTAKFVFITDPQTVFPNELSGPITIQSQDASGEKTNIAETVDLEFSSPSLTGEFLNSEGDKEVSTVMSRNTANRHFTYRDSTPGTYTITVRAEGRESGLSWQTSQQIVVSDGTSAQSEEQEVQQHESESQPSLQSSQIPVSPKFSAKILDGNKISILGAQVNFEGAAFDTIGKPIEKADFLWSFGEGATARGRLASHVYNYPGKYIVYLNIAISGASVSDSITVSVIPNEVRITEVKPGDGGWIEIFNGSDFKIELSHWAIANSDMAFYFPENTFIDAKTYLVIPQDISGIEFFSSGAAFLLYPRGDAAHELVYSGMLKSDESFHDVDGVAKTGVESPGNGRFTARISISPDQTPKSSQSPPVAASVSTADEPEPRESQLAAPTAFVEDPIKSNFWNSAWMWFAVALVFGILSAVGFLLIKGKGFF